MTNTITEPTSLQLATAEELIKELFSRPFFAGVLVYSEREYRGGDENHQFNARTTCDLETSIRLLRRGADGIEQLVEQGGR